MSIHNSLFGEYFSTDANISREIVSHYMQFTAFAMAVIQVSV